MEKWATIEEFPEYHVSTLGTVVSLRAGQQELLAGSLTERGYTAFILRKPGELKPYRRLLHRLMAIAFLPNPNHLSDVAHEDGNPQNRALSNLRWSTHRDNQMDMRRHGKMQDGEKCCTARITKAQALDIILRARTGELQKSLAVEYGISPAQISRIVNGSRWKHLTARLLP